MAITQTKKSNSKQVLNIAHRGFSGLYPENTMLAFQKAVESGCHGIELDVHLTKDHEVVIIHDETIDRTTNGCGNVRDYTLAELSEFDAYGNFEGQYEKQTIPSLRTYFEWVQQYPVITNIEIKNNDYYYEGLEESVIALVREYHLEDRILFSSFNHTSMLKCKKLAPEIKTGFLCHNVIGNIGTYSSSFGVECVHPNFRCMTQEDYLDCSSRGIEVNVWTVNTKSALRKMLSLPIRSIITNYPNLLSELLAAK